MTDHEDDKTLDYLWDPAAPADPAVRAIEEQLRPLRFNSSAHPLKLSARTPQRRVTAMVWKLAAAAAIVIATGVGFSQWRFSWPAGRAWNVSGQSTASSQLAVGATLDVPSEGQALVDVARIGTMRVAGGSRVTLRSTQGIRHRLRMETGQVHVRVWAPPGSVAFQTPTGEVIDLGCEFDLQVDADVSRLRVRSGWVQMDNTLGESLIPAGASGEMRRDLLPSVPVFDSASPSFRAAVRQLERSGDEPSLRTVIETARVGDVLTLLMLIDRHSPGSERIAARAAELWPPPGDVTVGRVARGDRDALWLWRDSLPLPPPKSWLGNWKDALPRWGRLP